MSEALPESGGGRAAVLTWLAQKADILHRAANEL
jgi:hypothetical protein